MTTAARTDIHRPKELVTEHYDAVGNYDLGGSDPRWEPPYYGFTADVKADDSLWKGVYASNLGRCDHCGAHIRYGAQLKHLPTGDYIHVGEQCLGNRFERATEEFQKLRKAAELQRAAHRIVKAREAYLASHKRVAVLYNAKQAADESIFNGFINDVLRKLDIYGEISDRQASAILASFRKDRIAERVAAANPEPPKVPVPEGKQTVNGFIVSNRWQDGYTYGSSVHKILVEVGTEEGSYRLWGTCPASISRREDEINGLEIQFVAGLERSSNDESFGFFKRPSKVVVLSD